MTIKRKLKIWINTKIVKLFAWYMNVDYVELTHYGFNQDKWNIKDGTKFDTSITDTSYYDNLTDEQLEAAKNEYLNGE